MNGDERTHARGQRDAEDVGADPGRGDRPGSGIFDDVDGLSEFAAELKLLAEAVLERVEPVLRHAAVEGTTDWSSCSWCPVCAAAALVRGEHHDVLAAVADHGTAIITVLREALAGVPVEPVLPPDDDARTGASDDNPTSHDHTLRDDSMPNDDSAAANARDGHAATGSGRTRSRYVGIPVTIKA
ncbi:hypothetical protein ACLMAJ_10195 [Nocardia sp. KC 131]|uniref:hypothetical protein n=1 Tax=Nocardia arseniciresistens TaxID=3392119 RepID=UPI00398E9BBB